MAKFYTIDPETCTLDELRAAIEECKRKEEFYNTMEQACKIFINSIYGAIGSNFYNCANKAIAESVTLQGQHLIKHSVRMINYYFKTLWHEDYAHHAEIAHRMKEKFPNFDDTGFLVRARKPIPNSVLYKNKETGECTVQVYGDTDSAYLSLQFLIDICEIPREMETDFDLLINNVILTEFLPKVFDEYAKSFNCPKNLEVFELEKIARTLIMLAKKMYIFETSWKEPNVFVAPLHAITYKGIEIVRGSTPEFCRKSMIDFINFVLTRYSEDGKLDVVDVIDRLRSIKDKFVITSPNDICKSLSIGDYDKFIFNDKGENGVVFKSEGTCPIHVRAAALYNNLLYTRQKRYKSKYSFIRKGDKVKFYYTAGGNVFAFLPNEFPAEFAPEMDYDVQFEKMILSPLNRIIESVCGEGASIGPRLMHTTVFW